MPPKLRWETVFCLNESAGVFVSRVGKALWMRVDWDETDGVGGRWAEGFSSVF